MTESVSCGQLFARRSEWQEKAFNELKDKLTATRDNRLLKYQDEDETFLVMICGKSQIGKTTLILKLIGIRDGEEYFDKVYATLRAGAEQGNSSTATAIIYAKSATNQYALTFARLNEQAPKKEYYDESGMIEALQKVRRDVNDGRRVGAEQILFIDIPQKFFVEDAAAGSIRIMDMPGVQSRQAAEWSHVENLMDAYLPFSQVCIVACNAADIQSLRSMELPGDAVWQNRPERFMVVSTSSYSAESIRDHFKTPRDARKEDFRACLNREYDKSFKEVMSENTRMELFPVELGQSLKEMLKGLNYAEDTAEVKAVLESTLKALRTSIVSREGRRFHAAIEDLRSRVDTYGSDRLAGIEQEISENKGRLKRAENRFKMADTACKDHKKDEEVPELEEKIKKLDRAERELIALMNGFAIADKLNEAAFKSKDLYKDKSDASYLKKDRDRKVLDAVLEKLKDMLDQYWKSVSGIYERMELQTPNKSDLPVSKILEWARSTYAPRYYPGGFFLKVTCADLEGFNRDMAAGVQGILQRECCGKWCGKIDTERSALKMRRRELFVQYEHDMAVRDRSLKEQDMPRIRLDALEKQKAAIEAIRKKDQEKLNQYLEVAKRYYLLQRDAIVQQMEQSASAEEKMKLFLLLALTERDYESLRRTDDGRKS